MLKDITLGQYYPGDTFIHRLDPRTKIVCVFMYVAALFSVGSIAGYAAAGIFVCVCSMISGNGFIRILKGIKPLIFLLIITSFINIFMTPGRVIASFYFITITEEGLITAAKMIVRIILLVSGTSLLTYTTSPIALTDAIESLLGPLKKIKAPVHELAMMMSIALRFIPTLIEETDKIMNAQKARGADFETGNLARRAKALIPILVPLFVSAFRRADELATAMECRLYRGGEGRTRLNELKMKKNDYITMSFLFVVSCCMIIFL